MKEMMDLTCDTIGELSHGGVRVAIDRAIQQAVEDLHDRPGMKKPRTITLTLTLKPISNDSANLDNINIEVGIAAKFPNKSASIIGLPIGKKGISVNRDFEEEPDQHALPFSQVAAAGK